MQMLEPILNVIRVYPIYAFVIVIASIILCLFLIYRLVKSPYSASAVKIAEFKEKETEFENLKKSLIEENKKKSIRFSTMMMKLRELTSSMDKEYILDAVIDMLRKGLNATSISIMMINSNEELISVKDFGFSSLDEVTVRVGDENFPGHVAKEGYFLSKPEAKKNTLLSHLIDKAPFPSFACVPIIIDEEIKGIINIGRLKNEEKFDREDKSLILTITQIAALSLKNAVVLETTQDDLETEKEYSAKQEEEKKMIKDMFGRYSSPAVIEQLIANPEKLCLGGEKVEATVLFSDIRGFTTYCENYEAEKVVEVLNEYLSAMTEIVIENDGTLDKFVGDEIMALWGVPIFQEDHARKAVRAAWKMLIKLKKMQQDWKNLGVKPLDIGIGINTGTMIVGNIGSEKQMDYTAIGDNVNIGARLEALTRKYKTYLIISESTYEKVKDIVEVTKLGSVAVKGKSKEILIYKVKKVSF